MVQIGMMVAAAAAMFWLLPLGFAFAGGLLLALLLAAKVRDAVIRGRRLVIARRDEKTDEDAEAQKARARDDTFFYAMWIGLTVAGPAHSDGGYMDHHGGDFGGDIGGGFDGGGDGGGGGF